MSEPAHEQVGYTFAAWKTIVDDERQGRFHKAVAINSTLLGDTVDVSVLSNDCLHGARPREALGAKRLHIGVRVRQLRPVPLGEDLSVEAQVTAIRPARRGRYIEVAFQFRASDGSVPVEIDHKSLILDAAPSVCGLPSKAPEPVPCLMTSDEKEAARAAMAAALRASDEANLCTQLHGANGMKTDVRLAWAALRDCVRVGRQYRYCALPKNAAAIAWRAQSAGVVERRSVIVVGAAAR